MDGGAECCLCLLDRCWDAGESCAWDALWVDTVRWRAARVSVSSISGMVGRSWGLQAQCLSLFPPSPPLSPPSPLPFSPPSASVGLQVHEARLAVAVSARMGVSPVLGVRAKLSSRHDGVWGGTSGERAKFGLSVSEVVELVGVLDRVSARGGGREGGRKGEREGGR